MTLIAKFLPLLALAIPALSSPLLSTPSPVQEGAPQWAPIKEARIHPGVNTNTQGGSCTSNFVFYQGSDIYIGHAAHCASTGEATGSNGCSTGTRPEGTEVNITGATRPGKLAYSSWARMQARGENDPNACQYNDIALVLIDPEDHKLVNPSVPTFGGPTGIRTGGVGQLGDLEPVFSYGNSVLRQGFTLLSPKYGTNLAEQGEGWSHLIQTLTPGIPGDSGSGVFDGKGRAFGVLSTLTLLPLPGLNGVGDLERELDYMRSFDDFANVQIAFGTEPFSVNLPDVGLLGVDLGIIEL